MTTASDTTGAARPLIQRSRLARVGVVLVCVLLLAAASWASIPMAPVPMTLQTLAVFTIAGLAGPRLTFEVVAVWLLAAAIGLPVLAGGHGGWGAVTGPTAGFLVAFAIAAPLAAWLAARVRSHIFGNLTVIFLAGHAQVLLLGWAWLAMHVGASAAYLAGVQPFLIGAVAKALAAALIVTLAKARFSRVLSNT